MVEQVSYRDDLEQMASEAHRSCGLVYELYVQQFSEAVESYLCHVPEEDRESVLLLARKHDYVPSDEREVPGDGQCQHFLDPEWCPMGCGDLED